MPGETFNLSGQEVSAYAAGLRPAAKGEDFTLCGNAQSVCALPHKSKLLPHKSKLLPHNESGAAADSLLTQPVFVAPGKWSVAGAAWDVRVVGAVSDERLADRQQLGTLASGPCCLSSSARPKRHTVGGHLTCTLGVSPFAPLTPACSSFDGMLV